MRYFLFGLNGVCLFLCCCKTLQAGDHMPQAGASGQTPSTCAIEGRIIRIPEALDTDTGSICSKHPCMAMVKITDVQGCGSSVSFSLNPGDTIPVKFAYSLENTAKVLPAMPARYPGLKTGDNFSARIQQRLKVGSGSEFVIYDYRK